MGLFKKKEKEIIEEKKSTIETKTTVVPETRKEAIINPEVKINNESQIPLEKEMPEVKEPEILNFEDSETKVKTTIEKKKDFRFILSLFGIVIIFVLCMPTIRNILIPSTKIQVDKPETVIEDSGNLEHGYLVIDKDSFKRIEDIKFFDFKRYEGNMIVFNYMPDKTIKKPSKLNIYIQIYDNTGTIVHKEKFNVDTKIKSEASNSYSMELSSSTYEEAYYAKVEVIEPKNYNKTLVCTSENKNEIVKTSTEINYNFIDNMLMSYTYNQTFSMLDATADTKTYSAKYLEQYNLLKKTNIKEEDISYSEDKIYYKVDYSYFDLGDLEFKTKYSYYDHYDIIIKNERKKGWTCE